jgi:hypothetical protein
MANVDRVHKRTLYNTDRILHHSPYGHTHTSTLESILRHAILGKYYAALSYSGLSKISKLACPEQLRKQFMKFLRLAQLIPLHMLHGLLSNIVTFLSWAIQYLIWYIQLF